MNKFDANKRGGLSVDRDSLHESPQYRVQLTAAQRLAAVHANVEHHGPSDDTKQQLELIIAEMKRINTLLELILQQGHSTFPGPR